MRNTAIAPTNIRQAGARLTFRDNHLRFRKFPATDSETYNSGTWHDAAPYGTGFLRVCSYFHSGIWTLGYQYVASPNAFTNPLTNHWEPFTDSGIQLEPWSTVAVEDGRIFYQTAAGNLYYVDFNGSTLGTPVLVVTTTAKPFAFAPVSKTEVYLLYKNAPADSFSRIKLHVIGGASIYWPGRLYGTPDYLVGFDAVRCSGRDRIYFTDENGMRTLYMTWPVGSAVFSDVRQLIPLDVVDETSSFVLGGASVINGKVFLSGVLKRDGTFPMHIFTYEVQDDHYSLGREMFIRSGQTRESGVTFNGTLIPNFPMPSGKLILVGDVLWYVAFGGSYYAYATQLVGVDRAEFKLQTSRISSLSVSSASNQTGVLQADVAVGETGALTRSGCEVDLEIGYAGQLAQIGKFDVTMCSDGCEESCKSSGLVAQSYAMKRLAQWEPDANFDYWSQTKVGANPVDLTKLIRQSGQWSGSGSIRLDKLNVDGFLYAVDRPSRNHLVRARFKFPSDPGGLPVYSPEWGVCLNYFSDSDAGTNAIVAYYSAGKVYLKLLRGDDFIATLGEVAVTAVPNVYYWLAAEFHDCQIRVCWGVINDPYKNISWSEILTVTYQELMAPWKRLDFIGRGALYMKNVTPHSMGYPFTSTEMIVPVEDNTDFPLNISNRFVIVGDASIAGEIIEYNGKSWPTRQVDLRPALGDAIVGNTNTETLLFDVPIAMRDSVQWSAGIQTFLLPSNYFINGVKCYIRKLPGETDDLTIAIYQGPRDAKRPVGVKIASCNIANDAIGEEYSWIVGNFGTPMFLNKTNRYWVVVHQSNNPGDPTNPGFEWALSSDMTVDHVQGAGYVFNEDADDWVDQDGDFLFALMGSTSVNAWTIILENLNPPEYVVDGKTYVDAARYNDMALIVTSGAGVNEMFKVVGYGGRTDAGNFIVFVDRDPANVVGEDTIFVLAPTLKVKTRGATYPGQLPSTATFHGRATVSLYRPLSPESDLFRYYSSEKDMRLEDIIAELAAKAGVVAYSDKEMPQLQTFDLAHQYSPVVTGRNSIVRFKLPAGADAQPKILFRAASINGTGDPTSGFEVGVYLDPADTIGAWLTDNKIGVVLDSVTIDLPAGQRNFSNAWVTVSIFEEHVSIWLDGYFLWSFNLKDYDPNRPDGDGLANAFSLLWTTGSVDVALDWSQCDQLRDNYIFDMGQNGMSLLSDLIKERRIFFQDDAYGRLRLLRNRVSVVNEDGAPYNLTALSSSNHTDAEFASRIRLVGAEIAEGFDRTALAEYGNVFRLKYSQMLDYKEEHKEEVQRSLVDAIASRETHSLVGAFDPRLEVNDVISAVVDGQHAYRLVIDTMSVRMALGPEEATCDMQIETHLHIPYDGGSDIIISSVGSEPDWSAGGEDPDAGERGILLYRAGGGVKEYARTPAGLAAAVQAVRWNDTIFIPPGEINFTTPTELLIPFGVSLTGAGKDSTILSGTVTLQVWNSGSINDLAIESTAGKLWSGGGTIYYLVFANGGYSTLRNCRVSLTVNGKHAAAYLNHGGHSRIYETDIFAKATGNVGQAPTEAACVLNIHTYGALRVYGGELTSSDLVVATQQHPPMPETNFVNSGAVRISGAIQVENT